MEQYSKKEKPSKFYNADSYMKEDFFKRVGFIYGEMVDFLPKKIVKVIELGCGPGFFASELFNKYKNINYLGIDFSPLMIKQSRKTTPNLHFMVGDLKNKEIQKLYKREYTYVCMETLEHINDDIAVIESIPKDSIFLFSVPNYDSAAHIRYFNNESDIINRYSDLLIIENNKVINLNHKNKIFMFKSRRK